jgi:hypothetical protein
MDKQPDISLHCLRKNGRREITNVSAHTLSEARDLANWVLHAGNGFYTEVDICTEDGIIETVRNSPAPTLVFSAP